MPNNIKISIKKEQISCMPLTAFEGEITLIDTPEAAREAVAALEKEAMIGFDTETRPSFKKGATNKVALMQLATHTRCYLFRLNKIGIGESLSNLIENPNIIKIGLSIHDDFHVMHRSSRVEPQGFVDLQHFVKNYCIQDISLQKIYAIIFGHKISKSQRLTNWEATQLTVSQQKYAALDAWACLRIYEYLSEGKFNPNSSPFVVTDEPHAADTKNTHEKS